MPAVKEKIIGQKPRRRRLILPVLGGVVALFLLAVLTAFLLGWLHDPPARTGKIIAPKNPAHIGDIVEYVIPVILPWHRRPAAPPQIDLPDGLQRLDAPARWPRPGPDLGTWTWDTTIRLQAYDLKEYPKLKAELRLTPNRKGQDTHLSVALPPLSIKPRLSADDAAIPRMAGEQFFESAKKRLLLPLLSGLLLLLVIGAAIRYFYRRAQIPPPPPCPWKVAETALTELADQLPMDGERFFVRLSDILRVYLEAAFHLPVRRQTTSEFLHELAASGKSDYAHFGPLLKPILILADQVKFAKAMAGERQMHEVLSQANHFITESSEPLRRTSENAASHPSSEKNHA